MRAHGATRSYLQVETTNDAAIGLYVGLGYWHHHVYRYRIDHPRQHRTPDYDPCMTPPTSQKLLVISFDDPLKAQEFLLVAARLQKDGDLQLHDAVIVVSERGRELPGHRDDRCHADPRCPRRWRLGPAARHAVRRPDRRPGRRRGDARAAAPSMRDSSTPGSRTPPSPNCAPRCPRAYRARAARQPRLVGRFAAGVGALPRSGARRDRPAARGGRRRAGRPRRGESPAVHRRVGVATSRLGRRTRPGTPRRQGNRDRPGGSARAGRARRTPTAAPPPPGQEHVALRPGQASTSTVINQRITGRVAATVESTSHAR